MADSTSKYLLLVLRIYKQIKTDFEGLTRYQKLKSAMILNCSSLEPKRQGFAATHLSRMVCIKTASVFIDYSSFAFADALRRPRSNGIHCSSS